MMKRIIGVALCMLCLVSGAHADQVTLAELKAQTPERLQLTITTDEGKTISVDAPIVLPEEDTLPILLCKRTTFDTTDLREKYPIEKGASKNLRIADAAWNYKDSPLLSYYMGSEDMLYGKIDYSTRPWLPMGETPPENDLTIEQAMQLVHSRIAEFDGDTRADIRPYRVAARGALYRTKMVKVTDAQSGISYRMSDIDPDKPIKKASKGIWTMQLTQYIHGAEIFPDCYEYWSENEAGKMWPTPAWGNMSIMDESLMRLNLGFLSEQQALREDAPLLSFPGVQRAIEKRVQSGQLKSIYRLTLGYSIVLVEGHSEWDERGEPNMNAQYVLIPTWQVAGYDLKDREHRSFQAYTEPDEQTVMQDMYGAFEVRFDAVTGEPLTYFEYALDERD